MPISFSSEGTITTQSQKISPPQQPDSSKQQPKAEDQQQQVVVDKDKQRKFQNELETKKEFDQLKPSSGPVTSISPGIGTSVGGISVTDDLVGSTHTERHDIHIRIQQRSGRKTLTTVQGLPPSLDRKRVLKAFKKHFACNGTIVDDEELGEVIQLSGDQRHKVAQVLIDEGVVSKDEIKIHGF